MRTYCPHNPPAGSGTTAAALGDRVEIERLQRALKTARFYGGQIDGVFGAATADACKRAKYRLGYPIKAVSHCGGQVLLDFLTGKRRLPLSYKLRRRARGFGLTRQDRLRAAVVKWARWGIANTDQIHYSEIRPIPHTSALPLTTDCSGFVTLCYQLADAPDPNGLGYNGQGWTGTLLNHGETIPVSEARAGDVVVWGAYPGHHAALILVPGDDPLIASHGAEAGPLSEKLSAESAVQRRPYVVKRFIR
jgi:hypothetical protein